MLRPQIYNAYPSIKRTLYVAFFAKGPDYSEYSDYSDYSENSDYSDNSVPPLSTNV